MRTRVIERDGIPVIWLLDNNIRNQMVLDKDHDRIKGTQFWYARKRDVPDTKPETILVPRVTVADTVVISRDSETLYPTLSD